MLDIHRGDHAEKEDEVNTNERDKKPLRIRNLAEVAVDLRREAQNRDARVRDIKEGDVSVQEIMSLEFTI